MRFAGTQLSNFMGGTMDYSQIAGTSAEGRSMERRATMKGEGMVANAGVQSLGKIASAEARADAIVAGGQAAGQSAMASGVGSMFKGLAGGISSMGSKNNGTGGYAGSQYTPGFTSDRSTQYSFGTGGGSVGGYGTFGPNWGFPSP